MNIGLCIAQPAAKSLKHTPLHISPKKQTQQGRHATHRDTALCIIIIIIMLPT
jgi:hypothetical protein